VIRVPYSPSFDFRELENYRLLPSIAQRAAVGL
jgi:hypothetical protein